MVSVPARRTLHYAPVVRAAVVVAATVAYLAFVFRLDEEQSRISGLGDWIDPYFINGLLEHWFHVLTSLENPATPPVFHPAPHALGYSHGLVLFAPFYVPFRFWMHPFHAYTAAIFTVVVVGVSALYALLRYAGRSFVESVALCALFCTSANVMNGATGVWTQRASVFLIPPVLLLVVRAAARRDSRAAIPAFAAGLLSTLLYVQDFYTAHFALLLALWFAAAGLAAHHGDAMRRYAAAFFHQPASDNAPARLRRGRRIAVVLASIGMVAAVLILVSGGIDTRVWGIRIAARDWRRPMMLAVVAAAFVIWSDPRLRLPPGPILRRVWLRAFLAGAALGAIAFLWIYLPVFRQRSEFPAEEVRQALTATSPYWSFRPFVFALALGALAWVPWFKADRVGRLYAAWLLCGSAFVWLVPLRFGDRAIWMDAVRPLPGFAAIRDPSRIIYLYELAVVIVAALVLRRTQGRRFGTAAAIIAVALIVARPNHERFDYLREVAVFDRWVAAPMAIDPACRSFFIKGASATYMSRSPHMAGLYGGDSMFIAFAHALPTLNGYSAWFPPGWELANPQEDTYPGRVRAWIGRHRLTNVCELDIDARTMRPAR